MLMYRGVFRHVKREHRCSCHRNKFQSTAFLFSINFAVLCRIFFTFKGVQAQGHPKYTTVNIIDKTVQHYYLYSRCFHGKKLTDTFFGVLFGSGTDLISLLVLLLDVLLRVVGTTSSNKTKVPLFQIGLG